MNFKVLSVIFFLYTIKTQDAPQVGDIAQPDEQVGQSVVETRYESIGQTMNEREILNALNCFENDYVFKKQSESV